MEDYLGEVVFLGGRGGEILGLEVWVLRLVGTMVLIRMIVEDWMGLGEAVLHRFEMLVSMQIQGLTVGTEELKRTIVYEEL